jgi:hypothetical protein
MTLRVADPLERGPIEGFRQAAAGSWPARTWIPTPAPTWLAPGQPSGRHPRRRRAGHRAKQALMSSSADRPAKPSRRCGTTAG